jgi:hypothetical protein
LEKRSEQVLLGSKGGERDGDGWWGGGGEMAQTMYTYMNKCINSFLKDCFLGTDKTTVFDHSLFVFPFSMGTIIPIF